jgi:hypothetical protein
MKKFMCMLVACLCVCGLSACKGGEDESSSSRTSSQSYSTSSESGSESMSGESSFSEDSVSAENSDSEENSVSEEDSESSEVHIHAWNKENIVTEPTCETDGLKTLSCECGDSYEVAIRRTGHTYTTTVTVPTCTAKGYTTYTCACGDTYVGDEVKPNGHTYTTTVTAPTCTEQGYTMYTCACGDTYEGDEVKPNGHTYTTAVTAPTCTEQGYTMYTCACGENYVGNYVMAIGHTYKEVITAPTCTDQGYTTYTCTCGDMYVGNYIKENDHSWSQADCIKPQTCGVCGETQGRALGHTYVDGSCSVCGELKPSEGLAFTLNGTEYTVSNGTCVDANVIIPSMYEGLPVTKIDNFMNCTHIISITIPDSVTSFYVAQFEGCTNLKEFFVSESHPTWEALDGNLYNKQTKRLLCYAPGKTETTFTVPDGVLEIGKYAFWSGCPNLTKVIISDSVTTISDAAFSWNEGITSIEIGSGFTTIVNYWDDVPVFDCRNLTNITVSNNNQAFQSIDGNLYTKDGETLVQYVWGKTDELFVVPDCVKIIDRAAFWDCDHLKTVIISNNVTTIEEWAFGDCNNLTSVVIGDSVQYIGDDAFYFLKYVYLTEDAWSNFFTDHTYNEIVGYENVGFSAAAWCYYVEEVPQVDDGWYWYYVDGVPTIW